MSQRANGDFRRAIAALSIDPAVPAPPCSRRRWLELKHRSFAYQVTDLQFAYEVTDLLFAYEVTDLLYACEVTDLLFANEVTDLLFCTQGHRLALCMWSSTH